MASQPNDALASEALHLYHSRMPGLCVHAALQLSCMQRAVDRSELPQHNFKLRVTLAPGQLTL